MKAILATFLIFLLLIPVSALGEIQTITHVVKQPFGGSQSADDARIAAIAKAKREALEMAGVYIEALTIVKDAKVDKDEILALTAGVLKSEVVSQKNYVSGDGFGIEIVVKIIVDPSILEARVKKLLQDRTHLEQLNQARKKEKELLDEVARLGEENRKLTAKKQSTQKLKKEFRQASRELSAIDWYEEAVTLWGSTLSNANASSYLSDKTIGGKKAIEYLSTAIKLKPDYINAYLTRGNIYSAIGQESLAMKDYKKVVQLEKPKDSFGYARRGRAYRGLKDYHRGIQDYDHAIQLQPDNPSHYVDRGLVYSELKQYQQAIEDFDEAIRLSPDEGLAYSIRASVKIELGQYSLAIKDYDEIIRLEPNNADAYLSRGIVYNMMRIFERAIEDYSQAILLRPAYHEYYISRGNVYGTLGQSKQAIRDFDQAILLQPDYAAAYLFRGHEYTAQDQYHLAIQDFNQAILLKPDYARAYNARGFAYILSGNTPEGCSSLIRACELGDCKSYHSYKSKGRCR